MLGSKVGQKWILGAYIFIILTSICQHDQLVGVCSGRLKQMGGLSCGRCCSTKGVLGGGSNSTKEVLGASQVKKGVFTAAHTCTTGHICECPPPRPKTPILLGYARI